MKNLEIEDKIKLMLYEKNKEEFEKFVIEIYRIEYPNIQSVKPQGQKGDGGNDGYVLNELVLQCYAPEHIDAKHTNDKIERDLNRAIKSEWKCKEWHFVINDKFQGIPRDVHHKIDELNDKYKDIEIKLIDSEILKNKLIDYSKNDLFKIYCLLQYDVDVFNFNNIELIVKIVDFISEDSLLRSFNQIDFINFSLENFNPDGIAKIKVNISNEHFLQMFGAYLEKSKEIIEEYKEQIGLEKFKEVGDIIKDKFNSLRKSFSPEESLRKTHKYFIERNSDKADQNFQLALWIVIAYFFDICDIGDLPDGNGK